MPTHRPTTHMTPPPSDILSRVKKDRPVGGVPPVRIPPLDAAPLDGGGPMAKQARVLSDPHSPLSPDYDPSAAPAQLPQQAPGRQFRVRPAAMEQPEPPAEGAYRPQLSQETIEGMNAIKRAQEEMEAAQRKAAEDEVRVAQEAEKKPEQALDELRTLFADDAQWSLLNNPARKREIESRLAPLDLNDMLMYGELRQEVPIVPGKLTILVRSATGEEDLACKQLMSSESGMDRYLMDKYSLMGLTLNLVSINGILLPSHLDNEKEFDKKLFEVKFKKVLKYPMTLLGDFGLQCFWFDKRVQALLADQVNAIKNS